MNDSNLNFKGKIFKYETTIKLSDTGEGIIGAKNRTSIRLSAPAEFGGIPGLWTPEDLLVSSVNSCLMTTFIYYAKRKRFKFESYKSSAEGTIELIDMQYQFTKILIKPKVIVQYREDIEAAQNLLKISKNSCLVSNSLKSKVILESEVGAVS